MVLTKTHTAILLNIRTTTINLKLNIPKAGHNNKLTIQLLRIVVFSSPQESDADSFLEKVYIAIEYLSSEPTSLDEYAETVIERVNQAKDSEIEVYEDFKTTIDQLPARTVIYSRQEMDYSLDKWNLLPSETIVYIFAIYTAERAKFLNFLILSSK